jgi:hypothetical protein
MTGHVLRMENSRAPDKMLDGRPEVKRSIWGLRLRWLDDVVNDLRYMGVRQWRKKAEDRQEWAGIVREAKIKLKWILHSQRSRRGTRCRIKREKFVYTLHMFHVIVLFSQRFVGAL